MKFEEREDDLEFHLELLGDTRKPSQIESVEDKKEQCQDKKFKIYI